MDTLDRITGTYGRHTDLVGILVDQVPQVAAAPDTRIVRTERRMYAVARSGRSVPIVCGDIVETIDAEGFRGDGRCGLPVERDRGACSRHAEETSAYAALTEAERHHLEREEE
jgi:hypothetical protein